MSDESQPPGQPPATPAAPASRSIIRRGSGSGLLARRRSRSRGTSSSSSVTFDLALEIPHDSYQQHEHQLHHPGYFSQSSSTRHVHYIEQDSQLIVRECFRQALMPRLSAEQASQVEEVLDSGSHVESSATAGRCRQSAITATALIEVTAQLRSVRHGSAVLRRVSRVNLQSLSRAQFEAHMDALVASHRPGNNRARIVSVLLFCTELARVAIRASDRLAFCQVLNWTMDYFRRTVSAWVVRAGGWDAVIQEPTKLVASIAFALSVLLVGRAVAYLIWGRH